MAFDAHKNFAISSVAVAPSPPTSGPSLTVLTGEATRYPTVPFNATVSPPGLLPLPTNAEIVRVTAIAGDVLTMTRTQEGSTARAIQVGDLVVAAITAKTVQDLETAPYARTDVDNTFTSPNQAIQGPSWARVVLRDTSQAANQRLFHVMNYAQLLNFQALDDTLAGIGGAMTLDRSANLKVAGSISEYSRAAALGHWTAIGYNAGNFTANAGTWTVEAGDYVLGQYTLIGKTLAIAFQVDTTSVSGAPTALRMALPLGLTAAFSATSFILYFDGSGWATALATGSGSVVQFTKPGGVAWANTTNGTYLIGTVTIPLP